MEYSSSSTYSQKNVVFHLLFLYSTSSYPQKLSNGMQSYFAVRLMRDNLFHPCDQLCFRPIHYVKFSASSSDELEYDGSQGANVSGQTPRIRL